MSQKNVTVEEWWNPVVEIATDTNPSPDRFPNFSEWMETARTIQTSIEAALPEEAQR